MGSTFFSLRYHIVFSTKERRPSLSPNGSQVFILPSAVIIVSIPLLMN
jgi:REP element-mobilizing transposase RayT